MMSGQMKHDDRVYLRQTFFGWVVSGQALISVAATRVQSLHSVCFDLKNFWELEDLKASNLQLTKEDV